MKTQLSKALYALMALLLLQLATPSFAQDLTIDWGDNVESETSVLKILGQQDERHYALTYRKKQFFVEGFSGSSMKRDFTTPLEFPEVNGLESELADIFYLDGQMVMFTVTFDKKEKIYNIYGYTLNEKGKIASERVDLMSIDVETKGRRGEFGFRISRDESKILAFHSAPYKKEGKKWMVHMKVITPNLDQIVDLEEEIPLKLDDDYIEISEFLIDNNAAVYLAARRLTRVKSDWITDELVVSQYEPSNGFEKRAIKIEIDNKEASSITLSSDKDGNLIGAGFYNERSKAGIFSFDGIAGTYFVRINREDGAIMALQLTPFNGELAEKILSEKQAAKGRLVPNYFFPREIIAREDGGAVLFAEYFTIMVSETSSARTTTYQHGPVLVANISPTGEIEWLQAIPKNQIYTNVQPVIGLWMFSGGLAFGFNFWINLSKDQTVYHSYLMGVNEETIFLVYNDNPRNLELEHYRDTKPLSGYKNSVPVVVKIDGNGQMSKEILLDKDRSEVVLRPGISYQPNYSEVLIYGTRKSDEKFGVIKF